MNRLLLPWRIFMW